MRKRFPHRGNPRAAESGEAPVYVQKLEPVADYSLGQTLSSAAHGAVFDLFLTP
ncbi:hypothetical protein [Streptomyces mirabilis]|uniref:hypothetical protein n=1 Tax=Streptomyces mirabilis TaxID=68239 RepID=UPI0036474AF2